MNKSDQISIDFNPARDEDFLRHNSWMFIEDLAFSKYSIKEKYLSVTLESKNQEEVIDFLTNKITIFRYRNRWGDRLDLKDSILELLETISSKLVNSGYCALEKVTDDEKLLILKVISGKVNLKSKKLIQLIPYEIAQMINCKTRVSIPKTKCFLLEFPREVCSSKDYQYILEQMGEIDSKDPMFSIMNPSKLSNTQGYDAMKHRDRLDIILRKLTREISWHHREQFSSRDKFSNYYSTLRNLKFTRTKIILMGHIFDFIKSMVESIFENTTLNITYDKTLADIDIIIKNYENGKFSHDLHMEIIREYSL